MTARHVSVDYHTAVGAALNKAAVANAVGRGAGGIAGKHHHAADFPAKHVVAARGGDLGLPGFLSFGRRPRSGEGGCGRAVGHWNQGDGGSDAMNGNSGGPVGGGVGGTTERTHRPTNHPGSRQQSVDRTAPADRNATGIGGRRREGSQESGDRQVPEAPTCCGNPDRPRWLLSPAHRGGVRSCAESI